MTTWRTKEALNETRFRLQNEWTSETPGSFTGGDATTSLLCECGDADCMNPVELTRAEYELARSHPTHFLIEKDHENPESEIVATECDRFAVVSKVEGTAMRIARSNDPRSAADGVDGQR
jgi:hypothetical protein